MIDCEHYQNYKGPDLTKATLNDENIINIIQEKYGEKNNWNGFLYKYSDIFGDDNHNIGKKFYCEFQDETGRIHWFHGFIDDLNQYFNPPLATPMNKLF